MLLSSSFSIAGIVIKVNFNIGKKSQPATCPGFGFCNFSIRTSNLDGAISGTLDINEARGSMILGICEKDIQKAQPDKIIYFKDKSSVNFTEDFAMPSEINTAAKVTKPLVIKRGEFALTYRQGMYYIEIPY